MIQTWPMVTERATKNWKQAVERYRKELFLAWHHNDVSAWRAAEEHLAIARHYYRAFVLGWFRKLLLPLQVDQHVPEEVSWLLAEEWDETTREQR